MIRTRLARGRASLAWKIRAASVRYARTPGLSLGLSVVVAIAFYLVFLLLRSLGGVGLLPPWLAAWGADLLFLGLGLWGLRE